MPFLESVSCELRFKMASRPIFSLSVAHNVPFAIKFESHSSATSRLHSPTNKTIFEQRRHRIFEIRLCFNLTVNQNSGWPEHFLWLLVALTKIFFFFFCSMYLFDNGVNDECNVQAHSAVHKIMWWSYFKVAFLHFFVQKNTSSMESHERDGWTFAFRRHHSMLTPNSSRGCYCCCCCCCSS